ncbi:MAG: glycosyltransferase, partial [Calditrichaeota bacterium]
MNILFISTEVPLPLDHGHHLRTYHVLKALAEVHTVHFVAFAQNHSVFNYHARLQEICHSVEIFPLRFMGWRQIILLLINLFSPLPLIAQKYYQTDALKYIKSLIKEASIDLIHIDLLHISRYRKAMKQIPSILVNHNVESLRILRWAKVTKNPLLKLFLYYQYIKLRRFERRACREFDYCITVSDTDRYHLEKLCGINNFLTIPNGVDINYFAPEPVKVVPDSLVWTGSMASPYNCDAVLYFLREIWPIINQRRPSVYVKFVGNSPPSLLKKLSEVEPRIQYTGYVEDVRPFVAEAQLFIAPIRAGSGTKIKILNAMAQGKAVVTTPVGAEGIDAVPEQEIIIADDPCTFADRVVYLLQHPDKAQKLGQRARKLVERKYDWNSIGQIIRSIYAQFENISNYNSNMIIDVGELSG